MPRSAWFTASTRSAMNLRQSSIEASARAVVMRRHARIVDLQHEAGIDDRQVFDAHRVGERREILLVGRVVAVLVIELEVRRRDRGDEGFLVPLRP